MTEQQQLDMHKTGLWSWAFHSFHLYLLKAYYVPGTVPDSDVRALSKNDKTLSPARTSPPRPPPLQRGAYILGLGRESGHIATYTSKMCSDFRVLSAGN